MSKRKPDANTGVNRRRFMRDAGAVATGLAVSASASSVLGEMASAAPPEHVALSEMHPKGLVESRGPGISKRDVLSGDVVSTSERGLVIRPPDSTPVPVDLTPDASVTKDRPNALAEYRPGDEVIVLGEGRGGRFTAVGVAALFRLKEATVYSRAGRRLRTSDGEIVLTPDTVARGGVAPADTSCGGEPLEARPLGKLKAGDQIVVRGLVNQMSGVMTATTVGVRSPRDRDPLALP